MSSFLPRADSVVDDIDGSMAQACAAAAAGNYAVAYQLMMSLHERISAWQHLPAHHQRRRMLDDLGFLRLRRVDASFESLSSPSAGLAFIDDQLEAIPDTTT